MEGDFVLAQFMANVPKFSGKSLFFGPGQIARLVGNEAEIFWPNLGRTSIRNTNNLIHFNLRAGGFQRSDFRHMPRITKMQNGRMISRSRKEEILKNLEEGRYRNAYINLRSELDFIETELENISMFELQDFKKEHYSPEVLAERYNKWKIGAPEGSLDKDVLDIKENLEENPKKKLVPRPMKKIKVIGSLPTVLEEDSGEEMKDDKDADEEKSSLSMPKGQRISRRTERRDYRGLC